ncbi:hypothetical protein HUX88_10280 [Duganella sp. BJB1802]|uniref:hypothetical protein n=1 Tax=Duganella sp. BJB1802 TaxID=2744575 RepID=UPI0015939BAA|nr:hypothetical protein [Duganella sp. BJB1802]NVD70944.1 hypothetical protein [Duganella sp. BJB1802]
MKTVYINVLLWLWSLVALCAAAAHIVMPAWTAAGTNWLSSAHWQREIAYFDIVLAGIFSWTARQSDLSIKRGAALMLCGLSLALGEGHLEGWLQDAKIFHVLFTVGNGLAALWSGLAFLSLSENQKGKRS